MSTIRERLLGAFEPGVRTHIVEYAKQISSIETDLIVLMARKAACFVDALQDAGLLSIDRPVTSERALDMDLSWVAGKTVTIVDDVLVSGSSLYQTREKLLAAGAGRVDLIVLSVDRDNDARLVTITPGHLSLSEQDSVRMCTQIVQGIALVPRPYNVDWPLLDGVTLPIRQMPHVSNLPGWTVTDLSSSTQAAAGVLALTYEASPSTIDRLDESIGWPLSTIAPLVKVRLYAYEGEDAHNLGPGKTAPGKGRMRLRGLPIVSIGALRACDIDELVAVFRAHNPGLNPTAWDAFRTPEAKLRLLQFACSARLGDLWRTDVAACADVDGWASLAPLQVSYAFPPHLVDHVRAVCANRGAFLRDAPAVAIVPFETPDEPPSSSHVGFSSDAIQGRLAEPFLQLFERVELPARAAFRERGVAALADPSLVSLTNRLRTGLRLEELEHLAATSVDEHGSPVQYPDALQVRSFVSCFLDLAVDHGVIVPIIEQRDECVLRTFRHGEDVHFAQSEVRLSGLLLAALASAMRVDVLPRILVEKALVLMVRHGIAESWLTQFYGRLGKPGTVGIRPDLHGAVVHTRSHDIFGHKEESSLASMLATCDVLEVRAGGYAVTARLPNAPTQLPHENKARALGASIGELLSAHTSGSVLLSQEDLKLLATIPTARDVPLALGAEVDIFHRRWEFQHGRGFPVPPDHVKAPAWLQFDKAVEEDTTFKAVDSGVLKYQAHLNDAVTTIIARVARDLTSDSSRYEWQARWDALRTDESGSSVDELRQITDRLGRWLVRAKVLLVLLRATKAGADGGADAELLRRARYREARELINMLGGNAKTIAIAQYQDAEQALREAGATDDSRAAPILTALDRLHDEALPLLDAARATAGHFGRPLAITTYTAAGLVTVRGGDPEAARRRLASLLERRKRAARPRHVVVDALPEDPSGSSRLVVLLRGEGAGRHLAGLVGRAFDLCDAYDVDVIAVPDLQLVLPAYKANNGEIHAAGLLQLLDQLPVPAHARHGELRVLASSGSGQAEALLREANSQGNFAIPARGVRTTPRGFPDTWEETRVTVGEQRRLRVDVGILSILPEEHRAVLRAIEDPEERIDSTGRRITVGRLRAPNQVQPSTPESQRPLVVACTQSADQGASSIQAAYEALQQDARPTLTVLAGIAGGIHEDVELGDVVIGTELLCYDRRAETADGILHRPTNFRVHIKIQHELNDFEVHHGNTVPGGAGDFTVHKGPIGTGQAVIKSKLSATRVWMKTVNDKILVVEMEAEGIATAARETGRDDAYLVVRGVSDHADEDKRASDSNGARDLACENALSVVCLLAPTMVEAIRRGKSEADDADEVERTPA